MVNQLAEAMNFLWIPVKDGDPRVSDIYKRHYSCYDYADRRRYQTQYRNRHLVMGPGQKLILLSADCKAILGWRLFKDRSGQIGVNCAFFRNEGAFGRNVLSSTMILAAEELAWSKWADERLYTYVDKDRTNKGRSANSKAGACFIHAGWTTLDYTTQENSLIILEKLPTN